MEKIKIIIILFVSIILIYQPASGQVRLPALVRDSMILQRDAKIKIWGWASPKEKIQISFQNKKYKTIADENGNWKVSFSPMKAGGPYVMNIDASNHIILHNILIGDVWLCSGQSNMVHQMYLHRIRYEEDIANANYPQIRQFWVPNVTDLQHPQQNIPTSYWKAANPTDVLQFSAVAYFFAKKIYDKYHVPIGLINASVGGPGIETWMSEESLKEFPGFTKLIERNKDTAYVNGFNRAVAIKNASLPKPHDKGLLQPIRWYDTSYIPKGWRTIAIPGYWEDQGVKNLDGIVWYRKEIMVPASLINVPVKLFMGRIVDADFIYVNGKLIGNTTYQYPQRRYDIPTGVLKEGKNIITIRVINYFNKGGFVPDKPYYLATKNDTIHLTGYWQYKVGSVFMPNQKTAAGIDLEYQPTSLYNAMIAPLINYSIKGFLWYQGEGNISNAPVYGKLLSTMIKDWRCKWQQGDLLFLYVQLPNLGDMQYQPSESNLAVLRQGQLNTLSVPNTQMAITIDVGEWNDIHPDRKKPVGDRLALAAEKIAYGDSVIYSGPIYQSSQIEGNTIVLSFTNVGSGLTTNDGEEPAEFAIAGADKKFVWAKTKIDGANIIVWSDEVTNPIYVRYAWADDPVNPNLYNKEGLPASPFQAEVSSPNKK